MKFMVEYPLGLDAAGEEWATPSKLIAFARAAEAAGIDAIAFTDHPAPSGKWLQNGGHPTLDPFVALGFCAAVTTTMQLVTTLTVVPYRNPLLMTKSMTTVDVLSGGRAIFVLGTGYLRSEFLALGVNFEDRNALFDEGVEVAKRLWAEGRISFEGKSFTALDQTLSPRQVQRPHPPLWLGGNSRIVRERVARWGDGWMPMLSPREHARSTRTTPIETDADFTDMLRSLHQLVSDCGRSMEQIEIMRSSVETRSSAKDFRRFREDVRRFEDMGVTWTSAPVIRDDLPASLRALEVFSMEVR